MTTRWQRWTLGLGMMLLVGSLGYCAAPAKPTAEMAKAAATKWLEKLGDKGLVLDEKDKKTALVGRVTPGTGNFLYTYRKPGWAITVIFKGSISKDDDLKTVQGKFVRVALDKLPTPGLEVKGWDIRPRTPVSSFKEGVEVSSFDKGVLTLRIKSRFFAVYGRDPSVRVPADGRLPKGSYFQIRKRFPLDLTLQAPLSQK